jgi:hypothetical protein
MNPTFSAIVEMVGLEAIGLKGKAFIYGTFRDWPESPRVTRN